MVDAPAVCTVQEVHLAAIHIMCAAVDAAVRDGMPGGTAAASPAPGSGAMRGGPLVVVGDTLLDVDLDGSAARLAPDAPVPVVDCHSERQRAGGAGLAAVLAARLGGPGVQLVTALGDDRPGSRLRELLGSRVQVLAMPLRGGTPCKIRVRASGQSLIRLDAGDGRACPGPVGAQIEDALRQAGAVLVADYGRGMTAHPGLRALLSRLPPATPVVWDPHPAGEPPVPGVRLATPNRAEARQFAALPGSQAAGWPADRQPAFPADGGSTTISRTARDAAALSRAWGSAVAVTLGPAGALLWTGDGVPFLAPADSLPAGGWPGPGAQSPAGRWAAREARAPAGPDHDRASGIPAPGGPARGQPDTCGAGDCFAAAAAQVLRAGGLMTEAVTEAVRCATDFVARGGAGAAPGGTVPPEARPAAGARPRTGADAWQVMAAVRENGGKIVATGGCFDLLHAGHVGLLRQARRLGDCLIVCINSDSSVRALKGPGRPLVCAEDRARVLTALECVDAVVVFDEPTPAAVLDGSGRTSGSRAATTRTANWQRRRWCAATAGRWCCCPT